MQQLKINGGHRLVGEIRASGAKNAALPILAASLLTADDLVLHNVPDLADVRTMLKLLAGMGVKVQREGTDVILNASTVTSTIAPYDLVKT
ncbi:UDP-N-acetylglucosamine 1-carboxyvinyltransferase, partial [gut metagenome]